MRRDDLFELAGRNLREALLRNSLTTLGIGVGVASLVALLSLGAGLQDLVGQRFNRSGLFNTLGVFSPRDFRGGERDGRDTAAPPVDIRVLDDSVRREIAALPNVVEVYPEIRMFTDIGFAGHTLFSSVSGLSPSARESDAFEGMQGRFFSSADAEEVIIQTDFARDLLDALEAPVSNLTPAASSDPANIPTGKVKVAGPARPTGPATAGEAAKILGKELVLRYAARQPLDTTVAARPVAASSSSDKAAAPGVETVTPGFSVVRREKSLRIVGIIESAPYAGLTGASNSRVFIPVGLAEKIHPVLTSNLRDLMQGTQAPASSYAALVVRLTSPTHVPSTQAAIQKLGFRTYSLLDATKSLRRVFAILDVLLGIFGSVALVVASLGIVNTLVMSVLERRREIGILKALGASDTDVKRLFFAEAGAMGIAGGLLGVALGWLIGRGINFGTGIYLARQDLPREAILVLPWWLALGAILFAVMVSLISGLYPAARAAKLNPVEALRYE